MRVLSRSRRARLGVLGALAAASLAALAPGSAMAAARPRVYVQTNFPGGNQLVVYVRSASGALVEHGRIPTGGLGGAPSMQTPITDSSGSIRLSHDGNLLFVTNAGSNTVSSFRLTPGRAPRLVDQQSSGGDFPLSLTTISAKGASSGLLYTVNYRSGNISGFRYDSSGKLTPIPGSSAPLSTPGPGARPASILALGRTLLVANRDTNDIDAFVLNADGTPGPVVANPTTGLAPFSLTLDKHGHVLSTDSRSRSITSYVLGAGGRLTQISREGTTGKAPCWISITPSGRYGITSDGYGFGPAPVDDPPQAPTGPGTLTSYALARHGKVTYLGNFIATNPGLATDSAISRDGRYLDVIKPDVFTGQTSVETYVVRRSGGLLYHSVTAENLPVFSSGMVESAR